MAQAGAPGLDRAADLGLTVIPGELPGYLRRLGVVPDGAGVTVTALGGGVSATVLMARWAGGGVVVKQPLADLAVADDWPFDQARAFIECDCLRLLAERMPYSAPEVVFVDEDRFTFGMTIAPTGGVIWRDEHDAGVADPRRTVHAARLLARLHTTTSR